MTSRRANSCEVAVIGAGPYGLSVAAHLDHAGFATHVFGEPMGFWRRNMPKGMTSAVFAWDDPWPAVIDIPLSTARVVMRRLSRRNHSTAAALQSARLPS